MYFSNVKNGDDLKSQYRNLCKKHHPDKGGDVATMQKINQEYDKLKKEFASGKQQYHYYNEKSSNTYAERAAKKAEEERKKAEQQKKQYEEDLKKRQQTYQQKADAEMVEKLRRFKENQAKSDAYMKEQMDKHADYVSKYFPNQKEILVIAIGGGQRYLTAWECDKFIQHLKVIKVPYTIRKQHLEYQVSKKKK